MNKITNLEPKINKMCIVNEIDSIMNTRKNGRQVIQIKNMKRK